VLKIVRDLKLRFEKVPYLNFLYQLLHVLKRLSELVSLGELVSFTVNNNLTLDFTTVFQVVPELIIGLVIKLTIQIINVLSFYPYLSSLCTQSVQRINQLVDIFTTILLD